ncbi:MULTISPECIES: stage III sporulation protein AD [Clostridium]|jgi:stage III sporulation protein AD|uniref:Stage III sporulation protein AD n=1 Tax=Clostridium manihotivorum TaxID=2320868 RepID=A0A410DSN7_9CLOT|nr:MULTISPECIES: stage III sporulation protein AD [Clostridium]QAA32061.1 stage III sporulation protein AD [Clostridium manihotivorum]
MLIVKIVGFCFVSLFLYLLLKERKSEVSIFISVVAGILIFLVLVPEITQIIDFIKNIANKANVDILYIGIVLKIVAIAYLTSFCSEICKDSGASSIATKVEFSGKIMILVLSIPVLMAVLDSILNIMQV